MVKKTPVRFHWRLLRQRRRGRAGGGEIREEEVREEGLTVEGEKCLPFARPFSSSGWCLLSKLSSNSGQKRRRRRRGRRKLTTQVHNGAVIRAGPVPGVTSGLLSL